MPVATDDSQLFADYLRTRSPDALGRLIERHIDFVHSAAVRQVRNSALAEDVTQAVFIILARKATSIHPASLAGWLFNTTRHCAANARRGELRRRRHERQAAKSEVQMQMDYSSPVLLDQALSRLGRGDREVVLLRYLQEREFAEVGSILGISEQTARRRLSRAIERLRRLLGVGGQIIPSAAVVQTLSSSHAKAPAHLIGTTLAAATGHSAAGGTAATLAGRTIHMMTWLKVKVLVTIILAAAVTGVSSVAVVKTLGPQAATAPDPTPAPPQAPVVPTAGSVATFSNGLKVELVGVAPSPIEGQQWWHPDGSPLAQPPYRTSGGRVSGILNSKSYEFAVKLSSADPSWSTGISIAGSNGSSSSSSGVDRLRLAVSLTPNPTATVQFIGATGPLETRAVIPASNVFKTGFSLNNITFTPGKDPKGATIVITGDHASMNAMFKDDCHILAVDLNGKSDRPWSMMGNGGILMETKTITFRGLRQEQIKEFQILGRPFNLSAEFQNVSLIPGQLTSPTIQIHETDAAPLTPPPGQQGL
jgi:RNA polymerase sigma factor (sigma-70 family)